MLHRPTEARLVRGIGLALSAATAAYLSYSLYSNYSVVGSESAAMVNAISVVLLLVLLATGFYFLYIQPKTSNFAVDVEIESRKVTWPEWLTVKKSTGQVTVVMIFLLAFLFVVDLGLTYLRNWVL